jgi:hypothetical protein
VRRGRGQPDGPADLERIALPVARGEVDYAKGSRLVSGEVWQVMPHARYFGGAILSLLTKIASGYWHVADSQSGYTAADRQILEQLVLRIMGNAVSAGTVVLVALLLIFGSRSSRVRHVFRSWNRSRTCHRQSTTSQKSAREVAGRGSRSAEYPCRPHVLRLLR